MKLPKARKGQSFTGAYRNWLDNLETDVIQGEYGYEPGEFTVYADHWVALYEEGLTPAAAFKRALDGFAQARREKEAARLANYERIKRTDAGYSSRPSTEK